MKKIILVIALAWVLPLMPPMVGGSVAIAQSNVIWIDVRTKPEWNSGHLEGAVLIPYHEIAQKIGETAHNKNQPIKLYCHSGRRAEIALRTLEQLGYTNVQNLGGYDELKK